MIRRRRWLGAAVVCLAALSLARAEAWGAPGWPTRWTRATSAPGPRYEAASIVVADRLYAFGGYKDGQWRVDRTFEAYDPAADRWTVLGSLPAGMPETHLAITSDGASIYLAGGFGGDIQDATPSQWIGDQVWRYKPASDRWTLLTHLPQPRGAGQLALIGRQLLYLGGNPADRATDMPDHFVYDLDSGQWSGAAPLPDPKDHVSTVMLGGRLYAIGGEHGHDVAGQHRQRATMHVYDPALDRWRQRASLPVAVSHVEGSTLVSGGRIIVAGGQVGSFDATARAFAYEPATNSWSALRPALPARRQGTIVQRIGQRIVVATGAVATDQPRSSTWVGRLAPAR